MWSQILITAGISVVGMIVAMLVNTLVFGRQLGRFEGIVTTKLEQSERERKETRDAVDRNRVEATTAIEKSESRVQAEIKDLRREQTARFDKLFETIVGGK